MAKLKKFEFLKHTADIKIRAFGHDYKECFSNMGIAIMNIITKEKIKKNSKNVVSVYGRDIENLLYNFLEEIIFLKDKDGFLVSEIKILKFDYEKFIIEAEFFGDYVSNYTTNTDVKAITYNEMNIYKKGKSFIAEVVVDV